MPDAVVIKVEKKAEKNALIHFDVGQVAWSPDYEVASKLPIGKPLPADWTVKAGEFGPQAFPPRPKGSAPQAAFRNTKEGFLAEAEGRLRWQHVEEERRDRRTALMQAVDAYGTETATQILARADDFYVWLREASGGSPSSASSPEKRSSQREAPPEETSVGGATQTPATVSSPEVPGGASAPTDLFCRRRECGHESALHPLGLACEGINGSHNDPEGGEYPCRCKEFVPPSGPVQGEGAANPPGGTTGEGGQAPSPTTDDSLPATAEDWAVAKRNGLTATKAKAIAKGLGFTPDNVLDLTRREVAAVINRYLEVKK